LTGTYFSLVKRKQHSTLHCLVKKLIVLIHNTGEEDVGAVFIEMMACEIVITT
jgi:hypothetical protein